MAYIESHPQKNDPYAYKHYEPTTAPKQYNPYSPKPVYKPQVYKPQVYKPQQNRQQPFNQFNAFNKNRNTFG